MSPTKIVRTRAAVRGKVVRNSGRIPPDGGGGRALADEDMCTCICGEEAGSDVTLSPVVMELYMGATVDCEPKGELVGLVYINPSDDGQTVTVTYETVGNFVLQQTHLYIGVDEMPALQPEEFQY